jgi:hypothetical protein
MVLPFLFPREVDSVGCGSGRGRRTCGGNVLRLIRDPFSEAEFDENLTYLSNKFATSANDRFHSGKTESVFNVFTQQAKTNRPFQFQEGIELVIRVHDEALTVAPVGVRNEDRSPFAIQSCDTAARPACPAEIGSYDFPVIQRASFS